MSQTQYETTIVIDSLQKADDMQNMVTKIENFIKNNGGTITEIEEWGKKRLAYEINRKQYGTYFHILFEGPPTLPDLLEAEYRLQESLLRYLTVKSDPRLMKRREKEAQEKAQEVQEEPAAEPEPVVEAEAEVASAVESADTEPTEPAEQSEPAAAEESAEESKSKQESPEQG